MEIRLTGVKRIAKIHDHKSDIVWGSISKNVCTGRLNDLGLSGDFDFVITFTDKELQDWLNHLLDHAPEQALKLCSRIQAEAICKLSEKPKA